MRTLGWSWIVFIFLFAFAPVNRGISTTSAADEPALKRSPHLNLQRTTPTHATALQSGVFVIAWTVSPTCITPPEEYRDALVDAAENWSAVISSTVEIHVQACWTASLPCDGIACGAPAEYWGNFPHVPLVDTAYPIALANALAGQDLNGASVEINIYFDSNLSQSLSALSPHAFVDIAMHELGHGLGFISGMYESYNIGFCGDGPYGSLQACPTAYDRFVVDSAGIPLLSFKEPDPRVLGAKLKSDANFGGPNLRNRNGSQSARLYTPATFDMGASISHLDPASVGSGDRLMIPSDGTGLGPLTQALINDLGWYKADGSPDPRMAGPLVLGVGQAGDFHVDLGWEAYSGQPITYTWSLPGGEVQVHSGAGISDTLSWSTGSPGFQSIAVSASGSFETSSSTYGVVVVDLGLAGITQGDTGTAYTFSAALEPRTGLPVTYTWQATDLPQIIHTGMDSDDSVAFTWYNPGPKTITVTASMGGGSIAVQQTIQISGPVQPQRLFLPLAIRS